MALCLLYVLLLGSFRRNEELRNRELRNRELVELGEAARTLAHEIKNPLAIVRIQTASLRRAATAPAAVKEALEAKVLAGVEIIDEELRRLAGLSDRIRDFLKGGTGDARELELAPFLAALSARYAAEQPPLLLLPVPAGARVFADPERLSLALDNLLRNAEEAAPGQSTELWVEGRGKHWAIVVADRGPGVPEELRERVFELFYTSKSGGSGIGLALARRIAEAAGGRLSCAAREGGGSLFVLSLPAFAAGAARAPDPLHA
jgi:signal transduction histidine kinase